MTGAQRLRGRKYIPGWVRKPWKGCSLSGLWTGRFRVKGEAWVGQTEVWMSAGLSAALLTCVSYTWKSHLAFVFIACFLPALQSERVRFPGKVKIRRKIQNPPVHILTGPVRWQPWMANAVSLQRKGWCSLCSLSTVLDGMKPIWRAVVLTLGVRGSTGNVGKSSLLENADMHRHIKGGIQLLRLTDLATSPLPPSPSPELIPGSVVCTGAGGKDCWGTAKHWRPPVSWDSLALLWGQEQGFHLPSQPLALQTQERIEETLHAPSLVPQHQGSRSLFSSRAGTIVTQ